MILYAPAYYKEFVCIADKCRHSCCIGWEIDVDHETAERYAQLSGEWRDKILSSIEGEADQRHFRLNDRGRCPHLTKQGLCSILSDFGETYLCHICREHPRFYHDTPRGKEVGLGMCCEEACRLILSSSECFHFVPIGELEEDVPSETVGFDPLAFRAEIYQVLASGIPYGKKIEKLHDLCGVSSAFFAEDAWRDCLSSLEYLDEAHRSLLTCYTADTRAEEQWEACLTRALAYFVFRYVTPSESREEAEISLVLSLLMERLLASLLGTAEATCLWDVVHLARILSEEIEYSEENIEVLRFEIFSAL